jgi:TolB-like protein
MTARLTQRMGGRRRIVGPTTTDDYRAGAEVVRRLRSEVGADFLLSGSVDPAAPDGLCCELVRTSDGAHVWAMTSDPADEGAARAAADSVVARLARG